MKMYGTVSIEAKAELEFTNTQSRTITRRMPFGVPKVFFQKVVMLGPLPIMITMRGKIRPRLLHEPKNKMKKILNYCARLSFVT